MENNSKNIHVSTGNKTNKRGNKTNKKTQKQSNNSAASAVTAAAMPGSGQHPVFGDSRADRRRNAFDLRVAAAETY